MRHQLILAFFLLLSACAQNPGKNSNKFKSNDNQSGKKKSQNNSSHNSQYTTFSGKIAQRTHISSVAANLFEQIEYTIKLNSSKKNIRIIQNEDFDIGQNVFVIFSNLHSPKIVANYANDK